MTATQRRNGGDMKTVLVTFDHDSELLRALHRRNSSDDFINIEAALERM